MSESLATYSLPEIQEIAGRFDIPPPLSVDEFPEKGNIHLHT